MPEPGASVVPIQVVGKGCSSRKWVVLLTRLHTSSHHDSISSCTSAVVWMCLFADLLRAFCTCVNMPLDPATANVNLIISPSSLCRLHSDMVWAVLGVDVSTDSTLAFSLSRRSRKWATV